MKQTLAVLILTIILIAAWLSRDIKDDLSQTYITKDLLEISQPFSGRIDTEFLGTISKRNNLP